MDRFKRISMVIWKRKQGSDERTVVALVESPGKRMLEYDPNERVTLVAALERPIERSRPPSSLNNWEDEPVESSS